MTDTVKLLRECNAGIKMGENAMRQVLPHVCSDELRSVLIVCKNTHAALGDEARALLLEACADTKDPHPFIHAMSSAKICATLWACDSDRRIACLMTDGCDMGIKYTYKHLNKYCEASDDAKNLARRLIASEEYLESKLRSFL